MDLMLYCLFYSFSRILDIDMSFLDDPVEKWDTHPSYIKGFRVVGSLNVVNDHAERSIKLLQDRNKTVTRKEERFQNIVNTEAHRRSLPNVTKKKFVPEIQIRVNTNK